MLVLLIRLLFRLVFGYELCTYHLNSLYPGGHYSQNMPLYDAVSQFAYSKISSVHLTISGFLFLVLILVSF